MKNCIGYAWALLASAGVAQLAAAQTFHYPHFYVSSNSRPATLDNVAFAAMTNMVFVDALYHPTPQQAAIEAAETIMARMTRS